MRGVRIGVAVAAAATVIALTLVAGFAARSAFAHAASPSGGAAQAVYCPKERKHHEQDEEKQFGHRQSGERKAYFAGHSSSSARAAFDRKQEKEREDFKRKHKHCD